MVTKILIIIFILVGVVFGQNSSKEDNNSKKEAERIWENAIKAKGRRENIYKIDNFLETSLIKDEVPFGARRDKYDVRQVNLNVLPNKTWNYEDRGKSVFGTTVIMHNYEKMTYYGVTSVVSNKLAEPMEKKVISKGYQNGIISLLLEAKGLKPLIMKVRTEKIKLFRTAKNKMVETDIVETIIDGRRVDFAFDRQTYLPIQVSFYYEDEPNREPFMMQYYDYVDNQGLKVPQVRVSPDGTIQTFKLQFNVEYNPDIFEKSPAKVSPDAWKKKP